jgi:hypothetical protein
MRFRPVCIRSIKNGCAFIWIFAGNITFQKKNEKAWSILQEVVRAKRGPYIPVVLSRDEIDQILKHLEPPYDLVVKML